MQKLLELFNKNKVLIIGLITSVALAVEELTKSGKSETKLLVLAGVTAALSFLGKNIRGQWNSIIGIVGACVVAYIQYEWFGYINWSQTFMSALIAYGFVTAPPLKSIGYEQTKMVEKAKEEGEAIQPSPAPPASEKKSSNQNY